MCLFAAREQAGNLIKKLLLPPLLKHINIQPPAPLMLIMLQHVNLQPPAPLKLIMLASEVTTRQPPNKVPNKVIICSNESKHPAKVPDYMVVCLQPYC